MKATLVRAWAGLVAAVILAIPLAGYAQGSVPFTRPQIEQLVAPIALYPDQLLGQILMAATYPLEVVEAARWVQQPENAALTGERLAEALQSEDWEPSVKSLVPFPEILQMMSEHLRWMQQLGDAFLAQQAEVMDAIQSLRARALATGNLRSTPQETVSRDGTTIIIVPSDPEVIYVPYYDVVSVYGIWPYPDYPPYDFVLYPAYGRPIGRGIIFGVAINVVLPLWGWDHCDWHRHRIRIDYYRYNAINRLAIIRHRLPRMTSTTWRHNPFNRRGVPYRDERSRERFGHREGATETRRAFRGFEPAPALPPGMTPLLPGAGGQRPRQTTPPAPVLGRPSSPAVVAPPPSVTVPPPALAAPPPASGRGFPAPMIPQTRQMPLFGNQGAQPTPRLAPAQPQPRRAPPAFGQIDQGRAVRQESERGRFSRKSAGPSARGEQNSGGRRKDYQDQRGERNR